ncbi:hypothetical protein W97_01660 [Coniosporium apollinis CBS 100218]|uniref:Uncharacterized protein n=1 Tax=Coniosporium apollinis (strain CBS 100218) TaxID=1168221 RepID=R7YKM3_CONA1|nr:uncharacterized protein W97_01660 [Coniosporium apollinis CBS 100218]EON62438.1 hypothetical protein W97_01660 [Coniosporium apollinis CBS 100218]
MSNSPRPSPLLPSPLPREDVSSSASSATQALTTARRTQRRSFLSNNPNARDGDERLRTHSPAPSFTSYAQNSGSKQEETPPEEGNAEVEDDTYIPPSTGPNDGAGGSLLPPPNFQPLFTLIEDASTGEHYHPSTYYIFSDDDPEIVTAASLRALNPSFDAPPAARAYSDEQSSGMIQTSPLPGPRTGVKERFLVVDMAPDGQVVAKAQSLNKDWQVTGTAVSAAPTWDEGAKEAGNTGLMLRVEGTTLSGAGKRRDAEDLISEARKAAGGDVIAAMGAVLRKFDAGMEDLDKIAGHAREEEKS